MIHAVGCHLAAIHSYSMHAEMPQSYPGSSRDDPDQRARYCMIHIFKSMLHEQGAHPGVSDQSQGRNPQNIQHQVGLVTIQVKSQGEHRFLHISSYVPAGITE